MVGQMIAKSDIINKTFGASFINLNTSATVADIGGFRYNKLIAYLLIVKGVLYNVLFKRPDLVYIALTAKGIAFYKDALLVMMCKSMGIKVIFHFHNKGVNKEAEKPWMRFFYRIVFAKSDAIVLSTILKSDISAFFTKESIFTCPNGIEDYAPKDIINHREQQNTENSEPNILYLGNLISTKGCMVLLEACGLLKKAGIKFTCVLVGGEGDISRASMETRIVELGLANNVQYLGKKTGVDKYQVFKAAEIFAFPTFYPFEAFPLVNIEAMQWALPIVTTFEGGIPDSVVDGQSGFLSEGRNVKELADKLEKFLIDKELRIKFGTAGRKRYEQLYTKEIFEANFLSILHASLNRFK